MDYNIYNLPLEIKKVITIIPVWGRHFILEQCINSLKETTIICVVSNLEDRQFARQHGCAFVFVENRPLSRKFQHAYDCINQSNFKMLITAVMMCGSDDVLSANWIPSCLKEIENGYDYVGKDEHFIYDTNTSITYSLRYREEIPWMPNEFRPFYLLGSGRMISVEFLNKIGWQLYTENKESGLDLSSTVVLYKNGAKHYNIKNNDCFIVSIKKDWDSITGIEKMRNNRSVIFEEIDSL